MPNVASGSGTAQTVAKFVSAFVESRAAAPWRMAAATFACAGPASTSRDQSSGMEFTAITRPFSSLMPIAMIRSPASMPTSGKDTNHADPQSVETSFAARKRGAAIGIAQPQTAASAALMRTTALKRTETSYRSLPCGAKRASVSPRNTARSRVHVA